MKILSTIYKIQQPPQQQQQQQILNETHRVTVKSNKQVNNYSYAPTVQSSFHRRIPALLLLQMLLLFTFQHIPAAQADWLMDCGDCHCKWNSGKKTADCKNLSIAAVPENLSPEVQVLDLSFNRIPYMEPNAFLTADLQNLHKLYIRNSSLQRVDPRTFTQLEILIELDLSNNLLRTLQANLFERLIKVRAIVLNGNLLESLGDGIFQNLKYLHKVELKDNRLVRIGTQVFQNVPLLSQIYLNGNRLNFLRKESFETLKRLTALSLDQNPWNCTCELQIFRDFVLKRNLYTPPTACYFPVHLRGMLWIEDQPEAFACKPRIVYPARGASINTSKENVTLVCRVHASPNTLIAWDYNKQLFRANTGGSGSSSSASMSSNSASSSSSGFAAATLGGHQRVHIQLLRDEQSKEKEFGRDLFISRLTILGAEKSDEGIYTCMAENAGGKDVVQMSLLVQKPGTRDLLLQSNLVIVISLMALGLLSVSVFLALVTCCIYKRFKVINPNASHHHHRHHHLNTAESGGGGGVRGEGVDPTTTLAGGTTNVTLDDNSIGDDNISLGKYKQQKATNLNLKSSNENAGMHTKYAEVIKHAGGVTVMDNGGLVGVGGANADKAYLERSTEDKLHIKYPHGIVAMTEINNTTLQRNTGVVGGSGSGSKHGGSVSSKKSYAETNGIIEMCGRTGEYQPDLLPAYNNTNNSSSSCSGGGLGGGSNNSKTNNNQQEGQFYSPIKATRTINTQEDHQQQPQHQQHQQQQQRIKSTSYTAKNNKYNNSVQEYLQSRFNAGAAVIANSTSTSNKTNSKLYEKTCKRETTSGISLTTSASLSAASASASAGYAPTTTAHESGFTTLQRQSKSLVLPYRYNSNNNNNNSSSSSSIINNPQISNTSPTLYPTEANVSYEYRQPPPPPYNAAHRTASTLLMQQQQRRTSYNDETTTDNSATKDQGYRDAAGSSEGGLNAVNSSTLTTTTTLTRQTIVTASPSLNFLTTTGYTPQRQLL